MLDPEGWRVNPEDDETDEDGTGNEITIGGKAEVTLILTKVETTTGTNEEGHVTESDTRPQTVRFGVKSKNKT